MKKIIVTSKSSSEAREKGELYYISGIPCVNGHVTARNARTYRCLQCSRDTAYLYHHGEKRRKNSKPKHSGGCKPFEIIYKKKR